MRKAIQGIRKKSEKNVLLIHRKFTKTANLERDIYIHYELQYQC